MLHTVSTAVVHYLLSRTKKDATSLNLVTVEDGEELNVFV
jgi:hypothetical protein